MTNCKICNLDFSSNHKLTSHIRNKHFLSKKEYYDKYLKKENEGICLVCKNITTFRGNKYLKHCSIECYNISESKKEQNIKLSQTRKGIKQTKETINKRIANTDQIKKEQKRKLTCIENYGVNNPTKIKEFSEKIGNALRGKKSPRKDENHQRKIIESKIRNNTIKHTENTKQKIKISVRKLYSSDDPPVTISRSNSKIHKTGYIGGFYYRSSYEYRFLEYCLDNNIELVCAENKKYRIPYVLENERHWYYPDFYLPKYDILIEVKPTNMLKIDKNMIKITEAAKFYSIIIVDEEVLEEIEYFFEELENEYILSG